MATSDLLFQIIDWRNFEEEDVDADSDERNIKKYKIGIYGRTANNETVYLKVNNYTPFFYVEIPSNWKKSTISMFVSALKNQVYYKDRDALKDYDTVNRYKFWGFSNYKMYHFIRLVFHNHSGMRSFERALKKPIKNRLLSKIPKKYNIYESNVEPFLRCMHIRDLQACGWVKINKGKYTSNKEDHKVTICDLDAECSWTDIDKVDTHDILPFTIASFDIECTSGDGSFPQAERESDKIIQIGTTFSKYGEDDCYYKHIVTLGSCDPIPGVDVESYENESDVLVAWTNMIKRMNPDIMTGYNIFGFDYKYLRDRSKKLGCFYKFSRLDRTKGEITNVVEKQLSSSALGDNNLIYYDMIGRVQVDLMKVIQKDHKLQSYKLDSVAAYFIRENIIKITIIEIDDDFDIGSEEPDSFMSVIDTKSTYGLKVDQYITIYYNDGLSDNVYKDSKKFKIINLTKLSITVLGSLDGEEMDLIKYPMIYWCQAKDDVPPNEIFRLQKGNSKDRAKIAKYCIQDCVLCNKLIAKLQIITNNIGMANVCHVPLSYLFLRGQGVKIFSLVSKKCRLKKHLIPVIKKKYVPPGEEKDKDKKKVSKIEEQLRKLGLEGEDDEEEDDTGYEGATVFKPDRGVHFEPVAVLDYASLYPRCMIHRNISHECILLDDIKGKIIKMEHVLSNTVLHTSGTQKLKAGIKIYILLNSIQSEKSYDVIDVTRDTITIGKKLDIPCINECSMHWYIPSQYDNLPGYVYRNVNYRQKKPEIEDIKGSIKVKPKKKNKDAVDDDEEEHIEYDIVTCRYAQKLDGSLGIVPEILRDLLDARGETKNLMKSELDSFKKNILDGLQLAYKVTANSLYGQTGARTSSIYLKHIAASTTATGREMLILAKEFNQTIFLRMVDLILRKQFKTYKKEMNVLFDGKIKEFDVTQDYIDLVDVSPDLIVKVKEERFIDKKLGHTGRNDFIQYFKEEIIRLLGTKFHINPKVIYGDSVVGNTPLILKDRYDTIHIKTIESLGDEWKSYEQFKIEDTSIKCKEQSTCPYQVWTNNKWSPIKRVIRHITNKKIYRVLTHTGCVDVTEDHSLLNEKGEQIKPKDCKIGTRLLNSFPKINNKVIECSNDEACETEDMSYDCIDQITAQSQYALLKNLGYIVSINTRKDKPNIFRLTATKNKSQEANNAIKEIYDISSEYYGEKEEITVYDLETEEGIFHAGIGDIVVKNTDSVFINFYMYDRETNKEQTDNKSLNIAIRLGIIAGLLINKIMPFPHDLEYEKTFWPFCILTKKRYVGNLYEYDPTKFGQVSMGIVLKRRDNAQIVKIVCGGIVRSILNDKSVVKAIEFAEETLQKILSKKYPMDKFIITKTLRGGYKDRTRILHAVLADRMGERDPGNKPQSNDRIPYAYVITKKKVELQGDRVENPDFIVKNNLQLDFLFYITNQIMKPSVQFLALLIKDPAKVFNKYIIMEENRRKGARPISHYFEQEKNKSIEDNGLLMDMDDLDNLDNDIFKSVKKSKSSNKIKKLKKINSPPSSKKLTKQKKIKIDMNELSDVKFDSKKGGFVL